VRATPVRTTVHHRKTFPSGAHDCWATMYIRGQGTETARMTYFFYNKREAIAEFKQYLRDEVAAGRMEWPR
jgi:hypothetical protein